MPHKCQIPLYIISLFLWALFVIILYFFLDGQACMADPDYIVAAIALLFVFATGTTIASIHKKIKALCRRCVTPATT